jgi:hypothetical protein
MMCVLDEPWFGLCLCRNRFIVIYLRSAGTNRFKTQLRQPIKVAMKVRDKGCGTGS